MRRVFTFFAVVAVIFVSGCENQTLVSPDIMRNEVDPGASKSEISSTMVYTWPPDLDEVGSSRLVRADRGISFSVKTSELMPGHAYTLWVVVFNNPEECLYGGGGSLCGPDDVGNPDAMPDMLYGAGRVVGASGKATFSGHRSLGDDGDSINAPVAFPAYGLVNPTGAEVHLVVHDHGTMIPAYMPDMIQSVAGGCQNSGIPEPDVVSPFTLYGGPEFGRRGPNTCRSIQFAIHTP